MPIEAIAGCVVGALLIMAWNNLRRIRIAVEAILERMEGGDAGGRPNAGLKCCM